MVALSVWRRSCRLQPLSGCFHITVLEKEKDSGLSSDGRNSGVMHSGIYYKPNSLKALNQAAPAKMMEDFCRENDEFKLVGKVIVATDEKEFPAKTCMSVVKSQRGLRNDWPGAFCWN